MSNSEESHNDIHSTAAPAAAAATTVDQDHDDYDKKCSDYIVQLRQELTVLQSDLYQTKQSRQRGVAHLELVQAEQRHLQQQLHQFKTRQELVLKVQQLQEQVAVKQQLLLERKEQRERESKQNNVSRAAELPESPTPVSPHGSPQRLAASPTRGESKSGTIRTELDRTTTNSATGLAVSAEVSSDDHESSVSTLPTATPLSPSKSSPRRRRMDFV